MISPVVDGGVLALLWLLGVPLVLAVINVLKGKYWFAAIGFFVAGTNRFPGEAASIDPDWMDNLRRDPSRPVVEKARGVARRRPDPLGQYHPQGVQRQYGHWPEQG